MRESRTPGSVRRVLSNEHPYRDRAQGLARIVHSGFLFRRVPEISVLIRVGESATFGAYHVWREHRECRLAVVA